MAANFQQETFSKNKKAENVGIVVNKPTKLPTSPITFRIPKYKEVPAFVIKSNMRVIGMNRVEYLQFLERA